MKMAPLLRAFEVYPDVGTTLIHTGQHYDPNLSDVFFDELEMPRPDVSLDVGSGKQGEQTARVLERIERVLEKGPRDGGRFDGIVVVGDVNSTMASALAAVKLGIPVSHVEAGLRSFDRSMPEEINRIVTDSVSELLFVSEPAGLDNLQNEGHGRGGVHLVGNVMIDTLHRLLPKAQGRDTLDRLGVLPGHYGVVTLHRPSNVDGEQTLASLLDTLAKISNEIPLVFAIHPRTQARLKSLNLMDRLERASGIIRVPPQGYLDFLALTSQARLMVTDSGGLQEESTALGIPCLTMRNNTERPVTVDEGTSTLIGNDARKLQNCVREILDGDYKQGCCPELWDGHAAERIAAVLAGSRMGVGVGL